MIAQSSRGQCVIAMLGILAAVAPMTSTNAAVRFHTHLVKSEPLANDTLAASPRAVRLWFSEQVELVVTTVKLADNAGNPLALAAVARPDTGEHAPIVVAIRQAVAPGTYTVTWSTAARDGHPAKGSYAFVVRPVR